MARTYVVTGSASGIGRATRDRLEAEGARVVGVDRVDAEVVADLSTPEGRLAMAAGVRAATESVDAVIACAGVAVARPLSVSVNYFGAVATLELLQPLLAEGVEPRAVAVTSMASILGYDDELVEACLAGEETAALARAGSLADGDRRSTIYASSKRALSLWIRRAAVMPEWAGAGIPLNGAAPGVIETAMTREALADARSRRAIDQAVPMPLGGPGTPEAVAALLIWLSSSENTLTTGQIVFIDGGADAVLRGGSTI
jgi:NAD(P)-dependent dehydrogenase (short-subunit alcohol dehydrogenase family)